MTCVIGLIENGKMYMGADSAGVSGDSLTVRADPKVFHKGNMLIGFSTSFRMGQLLRFSLEIPAHPEGLDSLEYMTVSFINAVRETLKDGGYTTILNNEESAGLFLVAYKSEIFRICSDFQVGVASDPFAAIGSGAQVALGAMHMANTDVDRDPEGTILRALRAAERFSSAVRGPFLLETLP